MVFVCTCAIVRVQRTTLGGVLSCQIKVGVSCGAGAFTWVQALGLQVHTITPCPHPFKTFCVEVRQQTERVSFPLYHMGFRDLTQVLRLGSKPLTC